MGLRDEARTAAQVGDAEGEKTAALARPGGSMAAPGPAVAAAEQRALQESIDRAHERHGVPDSAVYEPSTGAMADGSEVPNGRVIGTDARKAPALPAGPAPGSTAQQVVEVGGLKLTAQQYAMLLRPIDPRRVKQKQKQSHLEAWDDRRHLIRIFGFGGFKIETVSKEKIHEKITPPGEGKVTRGWGENRKKVPNEETMYTVVYDCVVRLTVYGLAGTSAVYEDAATGDGVNMPTYQAAADFAIKTAESQALKRCAVNLGDQFGLSLYNGGSLDPVVNVTLIGPVMVADSAVERAAQSGEVYSEPEPVLGEEAPVEDPGEISGPTGLPSAVELRDEALNRRTTLARLSAIYKMVHRRKGDHKELGTTKVVNETGDEEFLDALVYRQIEARKNEGEQL